MSGGGQVRSFSTLGTNLFAGVDGNGIFRSSDMGASWNNVSNNLTDYYFYSIIAYGTNLFVASETGVFCTCDSGASWKNVGLNNFIVTSLAISGSNLLAGTFGGGIWEREITQLVSSGVSLNQISDSCLSQNFPNPFSKSTTIPFNLLDRAFVSMKMYDITGREVATLANETLDAGSYTRTFNGEGMPNGTYLCRFEAGAIREEKTLLLLR